MSESGGRASKEDLSLEELKPQLLAISVDDLRSPGLPIASVVQEASDLAGACKKPNVNEALVMVGQEPGFVAELERRMVAAREAQSRWQSVRDQTKSSSLVELEAQAQTLRSEMLSAGRFNLKEREALSSLALIRAGETVDDLVQDLFDLATLFEKHAPAFERDRSFDLATRVTEARGLGEKLSTGISDERLDPEPTGTRELRDRAFTYLDDMMSELRAAGRYAFRASPSMSKLFTSRYRRRHRRGAKSKSEPQTEVVQEELAS